MGASNFNNLHGIHDMKSFPSQTKDIFKVLSFVFWINRMPFVLWLILINEFPSDCYSLIFLTEKYLLYDS